MQKEIKIKSVAAYKGHTLKETGVVTLSMLFKVEELVNIVQLTQMLNNDVSVAVKLDGVVLKLGSWRINAINISSDGEATLKLNSIADFVEVNNLNKIVTKDLFCVRFAAEIEIEEE